MPNPTSPSEGSGLKLDLITDTAGAARLKLSVGSNAVTGAVDVGGYQGVATHTQAASSFANGSPVVTGAGVDSSNVVRANVSDTDGVQAVRPRGLAGTAKSTLISLSSNVAAALPTSALASRGSMIVQADSGNSLSVFIGDSTVTYLTGIELQAREAIPGDVGGATLYAISGGAMKVRVLEVS